MKFRFIAFIRCLSRNECEGVTVENCNHPLPMISFITTNAFDCEKECKIHQDCFYFKFSERDGDGRCELFESEFRNDCHDLSGPLVSSLIIENVIGIQSRIDYFRILIFYIVN